MAYETPPETSGVPERAVPSKRRRPPSGKGLPSAGHDENTTARKRRLHPAAKKAKLQKTEDIIEAAELVLAGKSLVDAAVATGVAVDSRPVRELVQEAREKFHRRVDDYVEIHLTASKMAALDGDAKPAQWALERIAAEGVRVFDQPDAAAAAKPASVSIGIRIGGIPQPADQAIETTTVTARELPPMESPVATEYMP